MKTGLTKKQIVTAAYYNAKDPYTDDRRKAASKLAKENGIHNK